jgi:poly(3-hydroxybutyrate) depolymerase
MGWLCSWSVLALMVLSNCIGRPVGPATVAVPTPSSSKPSPVSNPECAQVRASGDAPLIDDFEARAEQSLANEGRGNRWFSYDDGTDGTIRRERGDVQSTGGNGHALHVVGGDFKRWGGSVAVSFHPASTAERGCPYDASVYTGVRLRARGQGRLRLMLADAQRTKAGKGGTCTRPGNRCFDLPGVWVDLEDTWRVYEFPFSDFAPDGWGGSKDGVDAQQLFGMHLRIRVGERVDAWLDDVSFHRDTSGTPKPSSRTACPLEAAPRTSRIEPRHSNAPLSDELTLNTFEQPTKACGPLTRRYLSYVPRALGPRSAAPVLIMLHGSRGNAEAARTFLARDRFDFLAARDRFIVVYGNAAPGPFSSANPLHVNNGVWREGANDDGQVDDVEYLALVLADLRARGVIAGDNPVFLVGHSNGGSMTLSAARRIPERLHGIAALMAFDGDEPKPVPELTRTHLRRVFLAYTVGDPAMPTGYHETMAREPAWWAAAMGIPALPNNTQRLRPLPDLVVEGQGYTGTSEVPLATRNSRPSALDILSPDGRAGVRMLVMDHAGHYWPNPQGDSEDWVIHQYGFRNQDLDAADAVWDFLRLGLE